MLNKDNFTIDENKISLINFKDKKNYKKLAFILLQHDQTTKKVICQKVATQKGGKFEFPFKHAIYLPICVLAIQSSDQRDFFKYAEKIAYEINSELKHLDLYHLPNEKEYFEAHKVTFQTKVNEIITYFLSLDRKLSGTEGLLSFININEDNTSESSTSPLYIKSFHNFTKIKQFKVFLEKNITDLTAIKEKITHLDVSEILIKNKSNNKEKSLFETVNIFITRAKEFLDNDSKITSHYEDYETLKKAYQIFILESNKVLTTLEKEKKELLEIIEKIQGLKKKVNELPNNKNYLKSLNALYSQANNFIKDEKLLYNNKKDLDNLKEHFTDFETSVNKALIHYELLLPQLEKLRNLKKCTSTLRGNLYSPASFVKLNACQIELSLEKIENDIFLRCKNKDDVNKIKRLFLGIEASLEKICLDCEKETSIAIKEHLYQLYRLYEPTKPLQLPLIKQFNAGHFETLQKDLRQCSLNPQTKLINKNLVTEIEAALFLPQETTLDSPPPEKILKKQDLLQILGHCFEQKETQSQNIDQCTKQKLQNLRDQLNQHIQDIQKPSSFFKRLIKLFFSQSTREKIQAEREILEKIEDLLPSIAHKSFEKTMNLYKETQEKLNCPIINKYRGFAFFKPDGIPRSEHLAMQARATLEIVKIHAHLR